VIQIFEDKNGEQEVVNEKNLLGHISYFKYTLFCDNNSMSFFRLNVHLQFCTQSLILRYDQCVYTTYMYH